MSKMKASTWALAAAATGAILAVPAAHADEALLKKYNCIACHQVDKKIVGPAYKDVAAKYKGQGDAAAKIAEKVKKGGSGVWGAIPMPPNPTVPDADIRAMAKWILAR
jgi:cytochrome c